MKQLFGVFAAVVLMPSFTAQAWVGGPFSNNNYSPTGDDGVYEAIATMSNGVGMFRWAVNNNLAAPTVQIGGPGGAGHSANVQFGGLVGAANPNIWYYQGVTYYGRCFGTVSSGLGIVSVIGNASTDGLDATGTFVNNVALAGPNTQAVITGPQVPAVTGAGGGAPGSGQVPAINTASIAGIGNNIAFANSSFIAKIQQKAPIMRFKGKGTVSFNGHPDNSSSIFGNIVTGVFTVNQNGPANASVTPSGSTTITVTGPSFVQEQGSTSLHQELGGSHRSFSQHGHRRKFIVFGSRVSYFVTPGA